MRRGRFEVVFLFFRLGAGVGNSFGLLKVTVVSAGRDGS